MTSATAVNGFLPPEPPGGRRTGHANGDPGGQAARQMAWQRLMDNTEWSAWLDHPQVPFAQLALPPTEFGGAVHARLAPVSAVMTRAVPYHDPSAYRDGSDAAPGPRVRARDDQGAPDVSAPAKAALVLSRAEVTDPEADETLVAGAPLPAPFAPLPPAAAPVDGAADPAAPALSAAAGVLPDPVAAAPVLLQAELALGAQGGAAAVGAAGARVADPRIAGLGAVLAQVARQNGWPAVLAQISVADQLLGTMAPGAFGPPAPAMPRPAAAPSTAVPPPAVVRPGLMDSAGPPARLRVHGEWLEQGVRIWLGADQSLQLGEEGMRQLGLLLQRLCNTQGGQLVSLVCNGKVVLGSNATAGAAPDRRGRLPTGAGADDELEAGPAGSDEPLPHAIRNYSYLGEQR